MENKKIHAKPALYAYYFEGMKVIAEKMGYNLVVHGSLNRDLDLIAIPWTDSPKQEFELVIALSLYINGTRPLSKREAMFSKLPGGRNSYVININRSGKWNNYKDAKYYIDLCFTPLLKPLK